MSEQAQLYPLKFEPIYQYRIWGGRRFSGWLSKPLPASDPTGEAWILSDREDHPSRVTNGKLKGQTIAQLFEHSAAQLMGSLAGRFKRFPLLLKFLDCKQVLSVQVHPSDQNKKYIPSGENGKTEAWVVLEKGNDSIIYAGLKPGTDEESIRASLQKHKIAENLSHFKPDNGDCVLIKAGTVHTLGDVVVFEVQENSDVTYRLYDWDRIDKKTGKPRDLQVEEAIACIDFNKTAIGPVKPQVLEKQPVLVELLVDDEHFSMKRFTGDVRFSVGKNAAPSVLVCIEGSGGLESNGVTYAISRGEVMLMPAVAGRCPVTPAGKLVLLEITIPPAAGDHES